MYYLPPANTLRRRLWHISRVGAAVPIGLGLLVLAGWSFDIEAVKAPIPGLISMKANTAIGLVAMGSALWLLQGGQIARGRLRLAGGLAALGVLIGALSLAEYVLGANLGIDELLFRDPAGSTPTVHPGRLAPQTAANFVLLGGALLAIGTPTRSRIWLAQALVVPAAVSSVITLLGYMYQVHTLATVGAFSPMALHTAVGCLVLSAGILAARPQGGFMPTVVSSGPGGLVVRRLVPSAVIALPALGWLGLAGERAGLYDTEHGIALLVAVLMLILIFATIYIARLLNRADVEQRRLAAIVEHSDDAIIASTAGGRITSWNRGAERIHGYPSEEALGQDIAMLADRSGVGEPDDLLRRALRGERIEHYETTRRHRDGRVVHVSLTVSPVMDEAGAIDGAAVIARDISARKASEERERADVETRIQRSQTLLDESQQVARVGSWEWDLGSETVTWSDETYRIHELDRDEFVPSFEGWLASIHAEDRELARHHVGDALTSGTPFGFRYRVPVPGGEIKTVQANGQVVSAADGKPERMVGTAQDLTESIRAQQEKELLETRVRQAERLESVGQLAGGIAHDFNNLLAVILNYASFVAEEIDEDHPARGDVEAISRAGERAAALTRQLLMFSRREQVTTEVLDLNEVIANIEELLTRTLGEQVDLVTSLDPDTAKVEADAGQVEQILVNLVVNARDAMKDGGRLTVSTSNVELDAEFASTRDNLQAGRYARLTVTDTGTGMPPEVAKRVFEPFFTTKAKGDGTGLGLATVYGIVSQSGGHIELYSQPGVGTVFKVYLPVAAGEGRRAPVLRGPDVPRANGETVLLVEDEPAVRELTRRILKQHGYAVLTADRGDHGLATWNAHRGGVDLVVTDVVMPGMSGRDMTERIRQLQPDVAVLYMSGYTDDFVARRGVVEDGARLIEKPFTSDDLLVAVHGVLQAG